MEQKSEKRMESSTAVTFESIVAKSVVMQALLDRARQVSRAGLRVILQGPTGTGKELLARAIHRGGPRAKQMFFPVNCGAIPDTLAESEFFGYEKGAFTGAARRRKGWCELADRGTLFLDEVTSLPIPLQAKLLRVLQDGRFLRTGGEEWVGVDVHVMAATNRDIRAEVRAGRFRDDLYYRLGATLLEIPALLQRRDDIGPLLRHFLEVFSVRYGKTLQGYSRAAWEFLLAYSWPGNVRQMEMVVECLVALEEGSEIDLRHFPAEILDIGRPESSAGEPMPESAERRRMLEVLTSVGGNRTKAAKILGISRPTLRARMASHGIVSRIVGREEAQLPRLVVEAPQSGILS